MSETAGRWARLALLAAALIAFDQGSKLLAVDRLTTGLAGKSLPQKIGAFYGRDHPAPRQEARDGFLQNYEYPVPLVSPLWHMTYVENKGIAFGRFTDAPAPFRNTFFPIVSAIAVIVVIYAYRRVKPSDRPMRFALGLVLAGAVGNNLIDRIVHGYVIDFIHWHLWNRLDPGGSWPVFNLADSYIVVAVAILVFWPRKKDEGERPGRRGAKSA